MRIRVRRARATAGALAVLIGASLVLGSCGRPARPPRDEVPGYQALRDAVGDFDFSPLEGRRIVLDPGHGGAFRGAVGLQGLTEAEVNLGVALYLRGLLEWAGAVVYLTRTADYDFLSPADSSLTADLAARVAFSDSLRPDVFLSIHHNSNAELDRDLNETQTYYPVGRDGPDLDLARAVHKFLVRNLQISPAKIMAGNFYVLRKATVPAVLGEPSMISNPVIEKRLSLAAKQELEAKAYFLGLREYFAGGMPRFASVHGDTIDQRRLELTPLRWEFDAGGPGAPALDPASVTLRVDGRRQAVTLDLADQAVIWHPTTDMEIGNHEIQLQGRNLRGRAAPIFRAMWLGSERWLFRSWFINEADETDPARQGLFVWESLGPDLSAYERLELSDAHDPAVNISLPVYPGKRGWLLLSAEDFPAVPSLSVEKRGDKWLRHEPVVRRSSLAPGWSWRMLKAPGQWWPDSVCPGGGWRLRWLPGSEAWQHSYGTLDPTAPVLPVRSGTPFWLEADGAHPILARADHREPWAPDGSSAPDTFLWRPILPELIGKVIVLDPAGGGSESDGAGPLGTRGADLNLRVAEMTAALLRGAGAEVVLTRTDERWVPSEEKVLLANRRAADLFLTVGRSQDPDTAITAHHHHGSAPGAHWASLFARTYAPLLSATDSFDAAPSYAYLLRHTACPALQIGLKPPHDLIQEELLLAPSHQQATARAIFLSIAALLAGEPLLDEVIHPGEILAARAADLPAGTEIDWLRLDGNFIWLPPHWNRITGNVVGSDTDVGLPGQGAWHTLEIRAGARWQLWTLRRSATGACELTLLFDDAASIPGVRQIVPPPKEPAPGRT